MDKDRKEIGPAVSRDHFDFLCQLIDEDGIRSDVPTSALTPARPDHIARTVAPLSGAARAILVDSVSSGAAATTEPAAAAATQRVDGCLLGLDLPPGLRAEFAALVQARADASASEVSAAEMWDMFEREYLLREPASALLIRCSARAPAQAADPWMTLFNIRQSIGTGEHNAALVVAATLTALGLDAAVLKRHSEMLEGSGLIAVYVECLSGFRVWGAGLGGDLTAASLKAVLSAVSRAELKKARVRAA